MSMYTGIIGVNSSGQGFSVEDTITDDSYFNISEIKVSIISNHGPYYSHLFGDP